jgi:hypothetical protein
MGVPSGTVTRFDTKGERESLSDKIYDISPEETPFMSAIGVGKPADQTLVEWQTDELADVDGDNAHIEGDDADYSTPGMTVRVGNYCQISRKTLSVSGTVEVTNKAGRKSERAYQMAKKSAELKRDQETILLQAQGGAAGSAGVARKLAGINAFVKTNVDKAGDGANPVYTSGVPSAARTDGTQRAFSETITKAVLQSVWTSGGTNKVIMVGPVNKAKASAFVGIATRNFDQSNVSPRPTAVIASADVYVSDFGTVRVIPNRWQRERDAWFLDFDIMSLRYLRPYTKEKLAKTGDSEKEMLICEYTFQCNQEAAIGLAADLTTTA